MSRGAAKIKKQAAGAWSGISDVRLLGYSAAAVTPSERGAGS